MNIEEQNYLDLMKRILDQKSIRKDRTNTGTKSIFGTQLRFSLEDNTFPLITTKKVFFRGIIEELLFFIRGETNSKLLEAKGINIWKGNTSREFLDKRGLTNYQEGEMGKMYGAVWRDFHGVDQLKNCLELIKNDPTSRRIIITAYDPSLSKTTVLDPCHHFIQFYVDDGKLSLHFSMRSVDSCLGLVFNLGSYSALNCIMAKASGLKQGEIIFSGGDTHIYKNHFNQVEEQLKREPYPFPKLFLNKEISSVEDMENLCFEDFKLEGYQFYPTIKADMAI